MTATDASRARPPSALAVARPVVGDPALRSGVVPADAADDSGSAARCWRSATASVIRSLLDDTASSPWLTLARAARRAANSPAGSVWQLAADGIDRYARVVAFDGTAPDASVVSAMSKPALWRRVKLKDGAPVVLRLSATTTLLVAPLIAADEMIGLLMLNAGPATKLLRPAEQQLVAGFCRDSLIACQVAQARDDALQTAVHADRARIALDLSDHIIYPLLGVGLELASLDGYSALAPEVQTRLQHVADTLDQAIHDLRTALLSNQVSYPDAVVIPLQPALSVEP